MLQLTQQLKDGTMEIIDVPAPMIDENSVLVRNYYSVISAGTEGKNVKDARMGYIAKAKARQKEVKLVIEAAKNEGLKKTYELVMNKLDALSPLGYSCAGEVLAVGSSVRDIQVGDFVACGGSGAVHAEVVAIPVNLCAKVDKSVDMRYASFTTVAAIAMQGIRQADLRLGESCVVIGLGLIGQITIQLLNAAGVDAIGVDIDDRQVALANELGAKVALNRNADGAEQIIRDATGGFGCDAVIITAGTSSTDPVELAGKLCRQKGKVIIVGAVPTGFSREFYYKKELELRMSCSYGPGRYDTDYEENGIDYPIGYVRWTENRNMQAFIDLLEKKKIDMEKLITHTYKINDAKAAYDMILGKNEPFIGVLLQYDKPDLKDKVRIEANKSEVVKGGIGFVGAGSFAQNEILPNIPKSAGLIGVATNHGNTAASVARKFGFENALTNPDGVINDDRIGTVFVMTRHNLHAENVMKCLRAGKNVFVEKPLCLKEEELHEIQALEAKSAGQLMIGYNRRFAPLVQKIKQRTKDDVPKSIIYRVNSGFIPKGHWTQDPSIGGGRILGEVCHFIDLAAYVAGAKITSVYATSVSNADDFNDILTINLTFANGSIASVNYLANGSKALPKEYLEVFYAGTVYIIDDYKKMDIYGSKAETIKMPSRDKGHKNEVKAFLDAMQNRKAAPISADDIFNSTLATFKVLESLATKQVIRLA
ncbi:MAG: bi-domain-containing oxidoreductase [Ignavibacteria bacterium]|nr:bi-domain-containing oxidoreductase [Ignavibacteria bacterium]